MKVEFHSDVADKQSFTCRLLRKIQGADMTTVVCADRATLDRLDTALWVFEPLSFVAHVRLKGGAMPPPALARTPTWLADDAATTSTHEVLVNLGPQMVEGWERFGRVIEVVSTAAEDVQAGRQRWRQYRQTLGADPIVHRHGVPS